MPQFIYTMKGLGKVHLPDHVVLKDIWLSFLPGAKIGVLGLNGSGKSTLLKIMAGVDHDFVGEAFPAEGITVGYLSQEPKLDDTKTVLGIVEEGVSEVRALLQRFDEINDKFAQDLSPEERTKMGRHAPAHLVVRLAVACLPGCERAPNLSRRAAEPGR